MGDPLMDLVEQRLQTSLSLDLSPRLALKSSLPFTILALEGSPVLHLFEIPSSRSIFGSSPGSKPKFGVVTLNGCITVYDTMFRKITWKRQTTLEKVSWGALSWRKSSNPSIMVHSRQQGFHHILPSTSDPGGNSLLSSETHIGFCKPYLCTDQSVIVPIGSSSIGLHLNTDDTALIQPLFTFSTAIMSLKEIGNKSLSKFVLVTTESGEVHVVSCSQTESVLISKLTLPKVSTSLEEQPLGTCIEGCGSTFVIGSNLRYIFLLAFDLESSELKLSLTGKKILPTEGISCLALRQGNTILGAGCFDGNLRIFSFPELNQIYHVHYHNSTVNSIMFLNETLDKDGRWYLLCGAADRAGLSVWSIPH